ncbi:MAG: hypothetical protein ACT4N4_02080 [Rhodospirillales bacterium]
MSKRIAVISAVALAALLSAPGAALADCTCRYSGGKIDLGQTICIVTPQGQRLARCDMAINNPSWTFLDAPCPTAGIAPAPVRSPHHKRPVLAEKPRE